MVWKEFYKMFLELFLPESLRDAREYEFDRLVQGDLTVIDYEVEFTQLSKYAGYLVQTEKRKIKKFVQGLNSCFFKAIEDREFKMYLVVVDCDRAIKA